jgi:OPA family glycerol-3-phosphate transporter-like MFS transporter
MLIWLRNKPSDAGFQDFDTGDQHVSNRSLTLWEMFRELGKPQNRILLTIVFIEFCTGAIRNGTIQNYPHFAEAVGFNRSFFVSSNWGLVLCLCGFVGAYSTGRISDRYFQSRRGPMSLLYYILMVLGTTTMALSLLDNTSTHGSWITGIALMVIGCGVIGVHGILSGTATGDFAGVKNTAKSVGIVDGAVYIGTSLQAVITGFFVTTHGDAAKDPSNWTAWPIILIPFAILGTFLCWRIYSALPARRPQPAVQPT